MVGAEAGCAGRARELAVQAPMQAARPRPRFARSTATASAPLTGQAGRSAGLASALSSTLGRSTSSRAGEGAGAGAVAGAGAGEAGGVSLATEAADGLATVVEEEDGLTIMVVEEVVTEMEEGLPPCPSRPRHRATPGPQTTGVEVVVGVAGAGVVLPRAVVLTAAEEAGAGAVAEAAGEGSERRWEGLLRSTRQSRWPSHREKASKKVLIKATMTTTTITKNKNLFSFKIELQRHIKPFETQVSIKTKIYILT